MDRRVSWAVAGVMGLAVGSGTYGGLIADPMFVLMLTLFWTLGVGLTLRYLARFTGPGEEWRAARWSGAAGGLMVLAATLGVSPTLPIAPPLRLALGLLIIAIWLTALNIGLALGLEHTAGPAAGLADDTD